MGKYNYRSFFLFCLGDFLWDLWDCMEGNGSCMVMRDGLV
jgi:hypothetical protein